MRTRGAGLISRRETLLGAAATCAVAGLPGAPVARRRVPVIDITDLYHPYQDPGDNFDLIAAYALPEVDLRAVILDPTETFRAATSKAPDGSVQQGGPREPGILPVVQLNYLFDRNVPYGVGPFQPLRSPKDRALDSLAFQQSGIELILETLRRSRERVHIVSFGSARTLAAAYNREPALVEAKVERIHLSAGATSPEFLEWNVLLDPQAIVCLLRSKLPIALYPCATHAGPFAYDEHNTFWKLPNLEFVRRLDRPLQRYLAYVFERSSRVDFLQALDADWPDEAIDRICARAHSVWETAVWMEVSGRRLVRVPGSGYRLAPEAEAAKAGRVLPHGLTPCKVSVRDNGGYGFETVRGGSNFSIYERGDWRENEAALREALPALYESFRCPRRSPEARLTPHAATRAGRTAGLKPRAD